MENVTSLLDVLYGPQKAFLALSPYLSMTLLGLVLTALLTCAGFILARMGYKPLWALILLVPTVNVLAVWALAYRLFPREKALK